MIVLLVMLLYCLIAEKRYGYYWDIVVFYDSKRSIGFLTVFIAAKL